MQEFDCESVLYRYFMAIIAGLASIAIDSSPNGQPGDKQCGLFHPRNLSKLWWSVFLISFSAPGLSVFFPLIFVGPQARTQVSPTNKN